MSFLWGLCVPAFKRPAWLPFSLTPVLPQAMDDIVRVGYVAHLLLVFPVVHFPLRFTADILFFPSARLPLHRDPVRFAFLTTCTMSLILFLGLLVPDIYALFSFLGALVAVSIGFTFPALLALM